MSSVLVLDYLKSTLEWKILQENKKTRVSNLTFAILEIIQSSTIETKS